MNSQAPAPHLHLSFFSQGLKVRQEEVGAATDSAASPGRCSRSYSWWPFSCPPGLRQVSDRSHPQEPNCTP